MEKKNGMSIMSLLVAALIGGGSSYLMVSSGKPVAPAIAAAKTPPPAKPTGLCNYTLTRVSGFNMVHPLLSSEPMCESPRFEGLRSSVGQVVDQFKSAGVVASASVYVRDFDKGEWTWYNGDELYDPGSMLKIPVMLSYLSMKEDDPTLMARTWVCEASDLTQGKNVRFIADQAQPNVSYTVQQLLELMIVHSDNRATAILMRHLSPGRLLRTFTDLGLETPDIRSQHYRMNVRDFSIFMKALYNSSYLSPRNSDYALELMSRSRFRDGLTKGIPDAVQVAHKFGEAGDDKEGQLHETALVYADGNTYLITVMTRGSDMTKLPEVLATISRTVYEQMAH